jgi:coatomer subunit beta'
MMLAINPKDTNTFASASLDRTIKVWGFGSKDAHFTLDGHDKGVNTVEYFVGGEKPYLITGGDDKLAKVWDYQNKTCVQTLEGHSHNVTTAVFHPALPIIVTGSEDGTVRIWHSDTYRLEKTLNYGLERVWSIGFMKGSKLSVDDTRVRSSDSLIPFFHGRLQCVGSRLRRGNGGVETR